jgi:hypothetical protein
MNEEMRQKILKLLDEHRIMTIATLRPDGWPQATTVGYEASCGFVAFGLIFCLRRRQTEEWPSGNQPAIPRVE